MKTTPAKRRFPERPDSRSRLTAAILWYAVLDTAGMVLFATGVTWFMRGAPLFIPGFPASAFGAGAAVTGGLLLIGWTGAHMLTAKFRRPGDKAGARGRSDVKGRGIVR